MMRKISEKFRKGAGQLLAAALLALPALASAQTVAPPSGTVEKLDVITITFSGNVTVANEAGISITVGTKWFGSDSFSVTASGNVATITLDKPITNMSIYPDFGYLFCEEGSFTVNGNPTGIISTDWNFPASKASVPSEPVITPTRGGRNLSLSEITLEWPGCGIEIVGEDWVMDDFRFGIQGSNYSRANIASIATEGTVGELGGAKLVIKVQNSKDGNKPFTAPGQYVLYIENDAIQVNAADGSILFPGEEIIFMISDFTTSPQNMQQIPSFTGFTIAGNDLRISDVSKIALYSGYIDSTEGLNEEGGAAKTPLAMGSNTTATEIDGVQGQVVNFGLTEPLYNGTYTCYVPAGLVTVGGKAINDGGALFVTFTVAGNPRSIPAYTADPAEGKVESVGSIKVAWGKKNPAPGALESFYGEILGMERDEMEGSSAYIPVTLVLPDEGLVSINATIVNVTDDNEDVDQRTLLGSYLDIPVATPYTDQGLYTFSIPANSFTVDLDNANHLPIGNVQLSYTIGEAPLPPKAPAAKVRVLPSEKGWFDAFGVVWADKITEPYALEIVDASKIEVTKNMVEDLDFTASLTEYQEDENTRNYPNSQLVVTLDMLENATNNTYSLTVGQGAVNILMGDVIVPNDEVTYSFVLQEDAPLVTIPDPTVTPADGATVDALSEVTIAWPGYGVVETNDYNGPSITLTIMGEDGETVENATYSFSGDNPNGDNIGGAEVVVKLAEEYVEAATYVINVPANIFFISNMSGVNGFNEAMELTYIVSGESGVGAVVEAENGLYTVYTLDGVKVLEGDAAALRALAPGLYIINGKKVLVRK